MLKRAMIRLPGARATSALRHACALLLVAALAAAVFGSQRFVAGALNADTLLPAAFWWDALNQPGGLWHHQTARIPSLVPDMAAYGTLFALTGQFAATTLAYGTLQFLLLVYAAALPIARLAGMPVAAGALVAAGLFAAQGAVALHEADWNGLGAVMPVFHTGPFALSLLGLAAARSLIQPCSPLAKWGLCAGLAATASLAFLSDLMLLVTFAGPLAGAATLLRAGRRIQAAVLVRLLAALAAGLVLGALALHGLDAAGLSIGPAPGIHPARFARAVRAFLASIPAYAAQFPGHAAILALLYGASLAAIARVVRTPGLARIPPATLLVWLFAILGTCATLAFTALLYEDAGSYRYLASLSVYPVLVLGPALARAGATSSRLALLTASVAAAVLLPGARPSALAGFDTPAAACLRRLRVPLGLHAALAGYWSARPAMIALHWSMQVDQVTPDGKPRVWANDPAWYAQAIDNPSRPPTYDAILVASLDTGAIERRYGPPSGVYDCGPVTLWHYADGAEVQRRLR